MIALPTHGRVYLACGSTDMRRGSDGLAVMVQEVLMQDPHSGALFAFKGKRGDLIHPVHEVAALRRKWLSLRW